MRAKTWLLGSVCASAVLCGLFVGVAANTGQQQLDDGFDWERYAENMCRLCQQRRPKR